MDRCTFRCMSWSSRTLPVLALATLCAPAVLVASDEDGDRDARRRSHMRDEDDERANLLVVSRLTYVEDPSRPGETFPLIYTDARISGIQGTIALDTFSSNPHEGRLGSLALTGITTSFSSKSEGALARSVDGRFLTYMGYQAAAGIEGVSNSYDQCPGTNLQPPHGPVLPAYNREVARIDADGHVVLQPEQNAYSGDNPRGVISVDGTQLYMAGNADSTTYATTPTSGPGTTIGARFGLMGSANSVQLATYVSPRTDETAKQHVKDNNFRGITIFDDALFVAKGSGGNGDNGVFQVLNTSWNGLPTPASSNRIIPLFSTSALTDTNLFPFGIWFADATTLYVADEGNASLDASGSLVSDAYAGLQKWHFNGSQWELLYVIQDGLHLLEPEMLVRYPVPTQTYGLRNLIGHVGAHDEVSLYAITAQFSAISGGEPDPTKLVAVHDDLRATHLDQRDRPHFVTLQVSGDRQVFRGVAFAPVAALDQEDHDRRCSAVIRRDRASRCDSSLACGRATWDQGSGPRTGRGSQTGPVLDWHAAMPPYR